MKKLHNKNSTSEEKTLDNPNWDEMRDLGKQMIDDMVDYLQNIHKAPAWKEVDNNFTATLPQEGSDLKDIYQEFYQNILPHPTGNIHPRFWSWVKGTGTLSAAFADFLASAMNPNVAIGNHSAMYVENQVINWCKEIMDFPEDASGILLSGGSIANITGLIIARNSCKDLGIRTKGL